MVILNFVKVFITEDHILIKGLNPWKGYGQNNWSGNCYQKTQTDSGYDV